MPMPKKKGIKEVSKETESENWKSTEASAKKVRAYRDKSIPEDSNIESETLDESKVNDTVEDVPSDKNWVESFEDTVAPIENAGSEEIDKSTRSERFAIEHEETTDKDSILRKQLRMKTDKPADETPSES